MPQTDFYLCERDLTEVGQSIFDDGGIMIPDIDYPSAELLQISDTKELRRIYDEFPVQLFFILSPKWQRAPLTIREIRKDGRAVFFISQRNGGPSLDLLCPRPLLIDGRPAVAHGFLAYHRSFWNPISEQMEPAPQSLKDTYRGVRSQLLRGGRRITRKRRHIIITQNTQRSALQLIDLKQSPSDGTQLVTPSEVRVQKS
jgi:hypothetical protein